MMFEISAKLCQKKRPFGERNFAAKIATKRLILREYNTFEPYVFLILFLKGMNKQRLNSNKINLFIKLYISWKT